MGNGGRKRQQMRKSEDGQPQRAPGEGSKTKGLSVWPWRCMLCLEGIWQPYRFVATEGELWCWVGCMHNKSLPFCPVSQGH